MKESIRPLAIDLLYMCTEFSSSVQNKSWEIENERKESDR